MISNRDAGKSRTSYNASTASSPIALILCLCACLLITTFAYFHFIEVDHQRINERLLRGTQTLASFSTINGPAEEFALILGALNTMQQAVLGGAVVDQQFLEAHTFLPESDNDTNVNLRYVPKVTLNTGTGAFEMISHLGETLAYPYRILDSQPEGLVPAGKQGEYYPLLLQASTGVENGVNSPGYNHFTDPQFHLVMDQSRDGGVVTSRTSFPLITSIQPYIIAHYFIALYTPGPEPVTIAERRARHTGFISAVSFSPADEFIDLLPESYLGLETAFIPETLAFSSDNFDSELQSIIASAGFAYEKFELDGNSTQIVTRPSATLRNEIATTDRWWALSIGLLLTTWLCSFVYFSRSRANKLALLVDDRTADLADRTAKLSELNDALTLSENRYRMLADNVSDVIFTHDADGICTYISPSITQQNGLKPEDYIGRPIYQNLTKSSANDVRKALLERRNIFNGNAAFPVPTTFESEVLCKDGNIKTIETTITILTDIVNKPIGYLGVSRDISDRKNNENEKVKLEAAFHQSQKMEAIGTLAGGVAHDFNNLLTGILGHAELLKTGRSNAHDMSVSISTIETAAIRAKELTSQLLGFARKGHYQSVEVNINKVVNETMSLLNRALDKNIQIEAELADQQLIVKGDPGQISQILLNLAVNSRDAMPNGGTLTFKLDTADINSKFQDQALEKIPPGTYCRIIVADTGVGIAAENLPRIFEPFFTAKPEGKGTGLGLAMVYGVTRNHGGTVLVSSTQGQGSSFTVYLPLEKQIAGELMGEVKKKPVSGDGTILVIDDEALVRDLAEMMLSRLGYSAFFAEDGQDGIDKYRMHQQEIDLVVVDMNMPKMGGIECVKNLTEINPEIKIILATGYSTDAINDEISSDNLIGFLQKPFLYQEFSELLADCLSK